MADVASAKKSIADDPKDNSTPVESAKSADLKGGTSPTPAAPATPGTAPGPNQPPVVRRGPGTKEVIPFGWKLVGEANGLALTLYKAIERDDVEAQEERVRREGYYLKLRILPNDDPVKQSSVFRKSVDPHRGTRTVLVKKVAAKKSSRKGAAKLVSKTIKVKGVKKKDTKKVAASRKPKAGAKKSKVVKTKSKKKTPATKRVKKSKTVKTRTAKVAKPKKKTVAKATKKRSRAKR